MTLEEQNKRLLELVEKYDTFADWMTNKYCDEIKEEFFYSDWLKKRLIKDAKDEFNVLRNELRRVKNDK